MVWVVVVAAAAVVVGGERDLWVGRVQERLHDVVQRGEGAVVPPLPRAGVEGEVGQGREGHGLQVRTALIRNVTCEF